MSVFDASANTQPITRDEPTFRVSISDNDITPLSRQGMLLHDIFNDIALMVDDEFRDSFNHMTDEQKHQYISEKCGEGIELLWRKKEGNP